jgi:hypothetical protein
MKNKFALLFTLLAGITGADSYSQTPATDGPVAEGNPTLKKQKAKLLDDNTFLLEGITSDSTYGLTPGNAVKVGGVDSGPKNERRYLNGLLGPDGQKVSYRRISSCCPVESKNGMMGLAMLDKYEVKYDGQEKPVIIFINMYDPGILWAPVGFTFRKE